MLLSRDSRLFFQSIGGKLAIAGAIGCIDMWEQQCEDGCIAMSSATVEYDEPYVCTLDGNEGSAFKFGTASIAGCTP